MYGCIESDLHFCMQAFSSCSKHGLLLIAVQWLFIVVASFIMSMDSRHAGFSNCDAWA